MHWTRTADAIDRGVILETLTTLFRTDHIGDAVLLNHASLSVVGHSFIQFYSRQRVNPSSSLAQNVIFVSISHHRCYCKVDTRVYCIDIVHPDIPECSFHRTHSYSNRLHPMALEPSDANAIKQSSNVTYRHGWATRIEDRWRRNRRKYAPYSWIANYLERTLDWKRPNCLLLDKGKNEMPLLFASIYNRIFLSLVHTRIKFRLFDFELLGFARDSHRESERKHTVASDRWMQMSLPLT